METPGRRATRSQLSSLGPASTGKPLGKVVGSTKKKEVPRPPFTDLTNDSPISGLMPAKLAGSVGCVYESTPRSKLRPADRPIGEDLLRMQVTSLLRKVESEAVLHNQKKGGVAAPSLFESPMRLAAPTPANTPAAGVPAQETTAVMLPPIAIASPIGHLDNSRLERISPSFVSTAELLSSIEEARSVDDGAEVEQSTPRTLKFDSPDRNTSSTEGESVPTPASISTVEILSEIEETSGSLQFDTPAKHSPKSEAQLANRTLRFESPQRTVPDAEIICELFSPSAHPHPRLTTTEDSEDAWSVIVNIHSPEKPEAAEDHRFVDVPTTSEVDAETMEFLQNVLVDAEICTPQAQAAPAIPAVWERRDTPARKGCLRDDDDFEDCEEEEEYEQYDEEEEEEEEAYLDGSDTFDEACEELCKGLSTISVGGESRGLPEFRGKHTRFTYNSDDEVEEDVVTDKTVDSPSKIKLMGLPTPKGKHIRFNDEVRPDEDEE